MSNSRTITVVATKNGKITDFVEGQGVVEVLSRGRDSKTITLDEPLVKWSQLEELLMIEGFDLENLKPTENVNKTTLEHPDAALPTGDFRLFLRPSKTKSGSVYENMSFRELRSRINSDELKEFLNVQSGKNWTQLSSKELIRLFSDFDDRNSVEEEGNDVETDSDNIIRNKFATIKECLADIYNICDLYFEERLENVQDMVDELCNDMLEDNVTETISSLSQRELDILKEAEEFEKGFI